MPKHLFITLTIVLFFNTVFGQFSFDHLSVTNGLSQSTVLAICKDSRGYMWFGTRDCLNRYDGKTVKIYKTREGDPASISAEDYIYAIAEDRQKNLWIGTRNGLNRYIPETDQFERVIYKSGDQNSISDKIILSIFAGRKGKVLFGTYNGLSILENPKTRKPENSENTLKKMDWPENGRYVFSSFVHHSSRAASISGNSIKTISEDRQGRIWIGTEAEGLNLFVPESDSFIRFQHNPLKNDGISNDIIRKIMPGKDGNLWIATMNGLNILDPVTLRFKGFKYDSENRKSLNDNSIKDIYEDNYGSVWIGTMFGGVNVTHQNAVPFTVYKYSKYRNSISSHFRIFELSTYLGKDGKTYYQQAEQMINSLSKAPYLAEPGTNAGFILKHSVGSIPHTSEIDVPLIYADYYFLEVLLRYKKLKG